MSPQIPGARDLLDRLAVAIDRSVPKHSARFIFSLTLNDWAICFCTIFSSAKIQGPSTSQTLSQDFGMILFAALVSTKFVILLYLQNPITSTKMQNELNTSY